MSTLKPLKNALAYIDKNIESFGGPSDQRGVVVGALADVTVEHAKSILLLIENHHFSSVFSLLRPMYETGLRMLWLRYCASELEFDNFIEKDKLPKGLYTADMVKLVEDKGNAGGLLLKIHESGWKAMNSFTHGGKLVVGARYKDGEITPNWTELDEKGVCQMCAIMILLSFGQLIQARNAEEQLRYSDEFEVILEKALVPQ